MPNPFSLSRMRNIFLPPETDQTRQKRFLSGVTPFGGQTEPNDFTPPPTSDDPSQGYFERLQQLRMNPGPATTAYQSALKSQPTHDAYKPTLKRRLLGAAIGGLTRNPNVAQSVVDAPYKDATEDYTNKMRNLAESARLEESGVKDQISGLKDASMYGLDYKKYLQTVKNEEGQQRVREGNLEVNKGNLGVNQGRLRNDQANTESLITNRRGTLKIAGQNANTAAAGQRDTKQYREKQIRNQMIQLGINISKANGGKVSPSQQAYALNNSLKELRSDSRFRDFITQDDQGAFDRVPNNGSPMYAEFEKRLKRLTQDSIKSGSLFTGDSSLDDSSDDVVIGSPVEQ